MEPVKIEKFIPGGQALGTLASGKKIMLWGALPDEIVTKWEVSKEKSSFVEGIATEIEQTSPQRIAAKDECYLSTSPWQILDYQYELEQKRELLLEIFRQQKILIDPALVQPVQTDGKDFYYRNKMEYALYYKIDEAKIYPAFRARGTHRKILIVRSSLERPEIWQASSGIIDNMNAKGEEARKYQSLLLRCDQTGKISGGLFENRKPHPKFHKLSDNLLGKTYNYSPNGFFQINLPVYEMVLKEISKCIKSEEVLDLYSGVGTIGLSVARDRKLTLVECDKSAYSEMESNCRGTKAKPILAKSEDAIDFIKHQQTVIVDPPRAGCMPSVIERIKSELPAQLIYLSCNPITQARDISFLMDNYEIASCIPYNFFPRTPHLENLIIMERK